MDDIIIIWCYGRTHLQWNPTRRPPHLSDHFRNATSFVQSQVKRLWNVWYYFPEMWPPQNSKMGPQYPDWTGENYHNCNHMWKWRPPRKESIWPCSRKLKSFKQVNSQDQANKHWLRSLANRNRSKPKSMDDRWHFPRRADEFQCEDAKEKEACAATAGQCTMSPCLSPSQHHVCGVCTTGSCFDIQQ